MKNQWKKLLFPRGWLMLLLSMSSAAGLVAVFIKGLEEHPIAYVLYVLSFYTLSVVCIFLYKVLPDRYRRTKEKVYSTSLGNRYFTDKAFKVRVSLYSALSINLLYAAFKLCAGLYYSSFWWIAVAVYYIVLSLIRFLLLHYMRSVDTAQDMISEYRRYRLTGILMTLLQLALSGLVIQMLRKDQNYIYPEIIIITMATYTSYTVTVSIIDIVRYRKLNRPVLSASKAIRFAAALVSLLSMETAMLAKYGEDEGFRVLMTALTGAGVSIIILGMSVYMILRANREIKLLKGAK